MISGDSPRRLVVSLDGAKPAGVVDLLLVPGKNVYLGLNDFEKAVGRLDAIEVDLLRLAASVYAADLAVNRAEREQFLRTIDLQVPVAYRDRFKSLEQELCSVLLELTDDN